MTAPPLPKSFRITCTADGGTAGGLLFLVILRMARKNDYHVVVGPSDTSGVTVVDGATLEADAKTTLDGFPSDYEDVKTTFAGTIEVRPMTAPQIQAALDAHQLWHAVVSYPAGHRDRLLSGLRSLQALNPHRLTVSIDDVIQPDPSISPVSTSVVPTSVSDPATGMSAVAV